MIASFEGTHLRVGLEGIQADEVARRETRQHAEDHGEAVLTVDPSVLPARDGNGAIVARLAILRDLHLRVLQHAVVPGPGPVVRRDVGLAIALELPAFMAGPGNIGPSAGVMDPPSGTPAGEVAYGLLGVEVSVDQDGPGGDPPVVTILNTLFGVSSSLVSALGNFPAEGSLGPGGVLIYERRLYVGDRNDVASVANAMILELAARKPFMTGTLSGNVDAVDTTDLVASVIATRVSGVPIAEFEDGAPVTHFRTDPDGTFGGIVLPVGSYDLEFRSVERDAVRVSGVVVSAGADTVVSVPPMTALGTVELTVVERLPGPDLPIPARVTFEGVSGTRDPRFNRDFEAFAIPAAGPLQDLEPETFSAGPA